MKKSKWTIYIPDDAAILKAAGKVTFWHASLDYVMRMTILVRGDA
jgi:hypothetical protein